MLLTRKRPSKARGSQKARPRTRSRAPAPKPRKSPREVVAGLEQRHLDLIGLGLIAVAVYLGCVLYVGWDGGPVGDSLKQALTDATGRVAYLVPIAVAGWAPALMMRPMIKAPGAFNAGAILMLASLLLAFAAETGGLGAVAPDEARLLPPALLLGPRGRARRGPVLGCDVSFPSARGPDPRGPDVRERCAPGHANHRVEPVEGGGEGGAHSRHGHARPGQDGAHEHGPGRVGGFEPDGRDIAITRAGQTEPLATAALSDPEMDEAETARSR